MAGPSDARSYDARSGHKKQPGSNLDFSNINNNNNRNQTRKGIPPHPLDLPTLAAKNMPRKFPEDPDDVGVLSQWGALLNLILANYLGSAKALNPSPLVTARYLLRLFQPPPDTGGDAVQWPPPAPFLPTKAKPKTKKKKPKPPPVLVLTPPPPPKASESASSSSGPRLPADGAALLSQEPDEEYELVD